MLDKFMKRLDPSSDRLGAMMEKLEVDPVSLARENDGFAMRQVFTRCVTCASPDECQHWLDGEPGTRSPAAFCPNHERLMRHKA